MAGKSISMNQKDMILRLQENGYSIKRIVKETGIARNTVRSYVRDPDNTPEGPDPIAGVRYRKLVEHFGAVEKELQRVGVTRQLLWNEYKAIHADGYNYSQYCYHLQQFMRHKEVTLHLEHHPGDETMIDFAG